LRGGAELAEAPHGTVGRQHVFTANDDEEPYLVDRRGR